jgi:3-oxoacyl-[acyl-carrier-protein] synthase II
VNAEVWVTGLGLVTPLGADAESSWARLVRGDRAIAPVRLFDGAGQRAALVAEVPAAHLPPGTHGPAWSRTSAMAVAAAGEAMRMARLDPGRARVGLVVGGTTGGMFETEGLLARLHADPDHQDSLAAMLSHPLSATAERLQERLGPFRRVRSLSSACSSGANAIVLAAAWLRLGELDAVVAGGTDGLCQLTLAGFNALGAIDPAGCRPFHRERRGTTLGEGAGFLVLERASTARSRGADPIVELAGWASGSEAHHITQPAPGGEMVASLMTRAMARAGLSPDAIDYVHAHGTGTPANDAVEVAALARALGRDVARVPVSSSKGQIGHGLGAAGAVQAVLTALVVARGTLLPTAALDDPDPALDVVHVPHVGRDAGRVRAALSNAFGFGGMDTVLLFAGPSAARRPAAGADAPAASPARVVVTGVAVVGPGGPLGPGTIAAIADRPPPAATPGDLDRALDGARARRLDTSARLAAVAVEDLLRASLAPREGTGIVLGSPCASVDASAAFMHRVFDRGPRAASPAEFPNLVPSAAAGNVSIYADLRGPTFSVADVSISAEGAFAAAVELVAAGEAARMVAGASEPRSAIGERVRELFSPGPSRITGAGPARRDLAVAILLESAGHAAARGAAVLARVEQVVEWRDDGASALRAVRASGDGPREVVVARGSPEVDALLQGTPWCDCPRIACAPSLGESDALGGVAIALAAARLGRGAIGEALVVGWAGRAGFAVRLSRPTGPRRA